MIKIPERLAAWLAALVFRYSWWVIIVYLLLAIVGLAYTSKNLGVNSDTSAMFSEDLPFRKIRNEYKEQFPSADDQIVVVVSGEVQELVSSTADSIAGLLKRREGLFQDVFLPQGEPFFKTNQLLYLDSLSLKTLAKELQKAKPMMSFLSENYSLKGLFSFLGLMVRFSSPAQLEGMTPLFQQMDTALAITSGSEPKVMSWQRLMGDGTLGSDGTAYSFIQITPVLDYTKLRPAKPAVEEARNIIERYQNEYITVRITGKKAMTYEEMGSVTDGAIQASILALLMVSIVLWIGLRSFRLIAATLITLIVGLILTASFSAWAVGHLNMISVAFTVLYIGLGVDYAIHLCLRYRELGKDGFSAQRSIETSINHIAPALILSTLSTSIGFYAFIPTAFTGVSELGIIAGTGMFISLLVTLTLLPALMWRMSGLKKADMTSNKFRILRVEQYRRQIRIATLVLVAIAAILIPSIEFDYDPINLRDPKSESVATLRELMSSNSFTPWNLNLLLEDSTTLSATSEQMKAIPSVGRLLNIYSFIPKDQAEKLKIINDIAGDLSELPPATFEFDSLEIGDQIKSINDFAALLTSPAYAQIGQLEDFGTHLGLLADSLEKLEPPTQQQLIDQLQSRLLMTLPYVTTNLTNSLNPGGVSLESLPDVLKNHWISKDGLLRCQVQPKEKIVDNASMKKFASAVQYQAPDATGDLMVTIASGETVVLAFKQAVAYALAAITILLLIFLRSIRETLYILLPLLLAGLFTGALTVVFGIPFNFANIIAIPLLLGLGVDNGVHIVHRAKTIGDSKGLLQTSTARAVLFSSLTTLLSFGNLAFSPHRGTASMGWLLTIGVVFVVLTTLVILPAFLPANTGVKRD